MLKVLLIIGTLSVLVCGGSAKDKPARANSGAKAKPILGTIVVYRQWSFIGWARRNWRFNVGNGPDLVVRNGTYRRVDLPPGDHVLDQNHMALFGSDPQTVHLKAGETVYFQFVHAPSLIFEVADDQAQAARTVSEMEPVGAVSAD